MPSTVTLASPKGPDDPGVVQVSVDGKDWAFREGRPVENVPSEVVKALDAAGAKYTTGKES